MTPPDGWDEIHGARGCTPQSCAFRDYHGEIKELATEVFGLSTQETEYQKEMTERLHLPFKVFSDENLMFCVSLRLPTFEVDNKTLTKRVTLLANDDVIEAVHYPVFPSDSDPKWVFNHLEQVPVLYVDGNRKKPEYASGQYRPPQVRHS